MDAPLLSVIIPCYNQGHFLSEALTSLEKVKGKIEVIIVNDGSTSGETNLIISKLSREKYTVVDQANQGLAMARNNGIALASGTFILPLDADNYIEPELVSQTLALFADHPEYDIIYTSHHTFGDVTEQRRPGVFDLNKLLRDNYIDALAVYRKQVWEQNGGYDAKMPFMGWEDWEFWISSYKNGFNFFFLDECLFHYRVAGNSMLRSLSQNIMQETRKYLFHKYPELYHDFNFFLQTTDLLRKYEIESKIAESYVKHLEENQLTGKNVLRKIKSRLKR